MKVGILTYHRAHNYGAVLQCYALQEVIRNKGHQVEIIDYIQPHIEWRYSPHLSLRYVVRNCLLLNIRNVLNHFQEYFLFKYTPPFFEDFRKKHLNCSFSFKGDHFPQTYNCYIIGSDQVWSIYCVSKYDPFFWGNFQRPKESKLFGYAVS